MDINATEAQHTALKAAALKVLERNNPRNSGATEGCNKAQLGRNFQGDFQGEAQLESEGRRRLQVLAQKWGYPLADFLAWYKDDLEILGEMSREAAYKTVRQYVEEYRD